jgi:predicted CXXCH cytochrome family protein
LCGDDHHPQFEQWSTSKHKTAHETVMGEMNGDESCMRCHSTQHRFAPEGEQPGLWDTVLGIECVDCHTPHNENVPGQLRLPARQLCAQCHTTEEVTVTDLPDQPQSEMLHATGGYRLDGGSMTGPHSEHWWGIAKECAACHVHKEPYGGPDRPVNSGHTFEANMRACEPCHNEELATELVAITRFEVEFRLTDLEPYFTPGSPQYVNPAGLPSAEKARYNAAKFNYEFVKADRSFGSHNALYTRALLDETERFFGVSHWLTRVPGAAGLTREGLSEYIKRLEANR